MAAQVAAQQLSEQAQKSLQDQATQAPKKGASAFDGVLANKGLEPSYVGPGTFPSQGISLNNLQPAGAPDASTKAHLHEYLRAAERGSMNVTHNAPVEAKSETNKVAQAMAGIMSEMEQGQVKLDALINNGLSGKELSNTEMLALQASMYKYTNEMELTGKVVEKATTGLKETLKTQV